MKLKMSKALFKISLVSFEFIIHNHASQSDDTWKINSCSDITSENTIYKINNNVSSAYTCFNILTNNITLDFNGYTINYSKSTEGYLNNYFGEKS
jgi:hypothetical protein